MTRFSSTLSATSTPLLPPLAAASYQISARTVLLLETTKASFPPPPPGQTPPLTLPQAFGGASPTPCSVERPPPKAALQLRAAARATLPFTRPERPGPRTPPSTVSWRAGTSPRWQDVL